MTERDDHAAEKDHDPATATDSRKTFDIYHVFSRWDLILLAGFVVILLLVLVFLSLSSGAPGG